MDVSFERPDLADPGLAVRWAEMAATCDVPAFRRWPWIGALAAERTPEPLLATVTENGRTVAMALLNARHGRLGRTLFLHETGDPALDATFVEHNGLLADPADEPAALQALLRACGRRAGRVRLAGIDDRLLAAVRRSGGTIGPIQTRPAPFVRLGPDYQSTLSANTRAQVRRSDRSYALCGPLRVHRADDAAEALHWLDRLLSLHRAGWAARGVASAFTTEPVQRFVRTMIGLGAPDTVELLHVAAGSRTVGYLLNLRAGGRVAAYQSGFDYAGARRHEKPGLTCHTAAIADALARGDNEYDFLAGAARYKDSLAGDVRQLHWLDWHPAWSPQAVPARLRLWRERWLHNRTAATPDLRQNAPAEL